MKLLLDTHVFLWWANEPQRLSPMVVSLCLDPANTLILSIISVWEIQIKSQLGKLKMTVPLAELIGAQQRVNDLRLLPIELPHVLALENLPPHHKDPFDRLLIAQAIIEDLYLVSADAVVSGYSVKLLW